MPTRINTSIPFRSSRLAVPPSPFSPLLPITPPTRTIASSTTAAQLKMGLTAQAPPPPTRDPMRWLWVCHICHRSYSLGVTRRCLDDGHFFCAGTSTVRSRRDGSRKVRRHRACSSEFDYAGWKDWGVWRRNVAAGTEQREASRDSVFEGDSEEDEEEGDVEEIVAARPVLLHKDCWNRCDYPSECRWGKQFGVDTPVQVSFPTLDRVASVPSPDTIAEFVDVDMSDAPAPPKTDFKDILTAEQQQVVAETIDGVDVDEVVAHTPTPALSDLANLVFRAQRRHSRTEVPSSPLSVVEDGPRQRITRSSSRETLRRAVEGGIGAIAGLVGGWRSNSAPPTSERRQLDRADDGDTEMGGMNLERRRSLE